MSSQAYSKQSKFVRNSQYPDIKLVYETGKSLSKRVFDFTMALLGLIILAPVFLYISILIKRDSPGPVFYWGTRMGKGGHPFKMLKFRTMYERPESYQGPPVTADGDDRITPLGRWLRDTKINELPQLWNVLIGEMSLVGPRPEDVKIAKTWPKEAFEEILSVSPGITSPASILYHDEEKLLSKANVMGDYLKGILPDKIRLDGLYVRHHSFFSDLDVIFWTIAIIIPRLANTKIPEGYLFAGPISRLAHRYVNWFLVDFLVAMSIAYFAGLLWGVGASNSGTNHLVILALILALLFSGFNSIVGLNRVLWSQATLDDAMGLMVSSIFVTTLIWMLKRLNHFYQWLPFSPLPTDMIIVIGIIAGVGFFLARYRLRVLTALASRWLNWRQGASKVGEQVLVVGLSEGTKIANYLFKQRTFRTAFSIVGVVDNDYPSQYGMRITGFWMLGGINDIPDLIKRHDIGVVLSTLPQHNPDNERILELCQLSHSRLIFLDDLLSLVDRQETQPLGEIDSQVLLDGRLEYKAMHDVLTGLPNRYLLQDRIQLAFSRAKRYQTQPALIFIEVDGIVSINDIHGDKLSGEVLKGLVKRVVACKRESDTLARFGFDKFALLLENVPGEQEIQLIAQRILASMSQPFDIKGHKFLISPKIGICSCQSTCGAFEAPKKVEIAKCFSCAMSKVVVNMYETVN